MHHLEQPSPSCVPWRGKRGRENGSTLIEPLVAMAIIAGSLAFFIRAQLNYRQVERDFVTRTAALRLVRLEYELALLSSLDEQPASTRLKCHAGSCTLDFLPGELPLVFSPSKSGSASDE